MRAVVQRINRGNISVEEKTVASVERGLLVYLGIGRGDSEKDAKYLADKIINLRIFPDEAGVMNRSLLQNGGRILVVSQFTLYGDTRKGRRPSYNRAAGPESGKALYNYFMKVIEQAGIEVESGVFQAHMKVTSTNDGPVTILIDSHKEF